MKRPALYLFCFLLLCQVTLCVGEADPPPSSTPAAPVQAASAETTSPTLGPAQPRPAEWAQPLELGGVPNFFKVTDNLYRGA
ncbi:hypothetical protein JW916_06655 [Candidatus Sumerlaeota bacterium]|nr:hypothetical protein [Candidatus Sumerlaeota bacterium]